jgi:hypothetical protein
MFRQYTGPTAAPAGALPVRDNRRIMSIDTRFFDEWTEIV